MGSDVLQDSPYQLESSEIHSPPGAIFSSSSSITIWAIMYRLYRIQSFVRTLEVKSKHSYLKV